MTNTAIVNAISVEISGSFWDGWYSPIDAEPGSTDTGESMVKFCDLVERRLYAVYPCTDVIVEPGHESMIGDRINVATDDDAPQDVCLAKVAEILEDTWQDSDEWVVLVSQSQA